MVDEISTAKILSEHNPCTMLTKMWREDSPNVYVCFDDYYEGYRKYARSVGIGLSVQIYDARTDKLIINQAYIPENVQVKEFARQILLDYLKRVR